MRYVLIRQRTVMLDTVTGLRWHVPPELLDLFDYSKVAVHVNPPSPPDLVPLRESVSQALGKGYRGGHRQRWAAQPRPQR